MVGLRDIYVHMIYLMSMGLKTVKLNLLNIIDTLQELRRREGEHIKNTDCINKYVAGRTDKEYYEDNIDNKRA